MSWKCTCCGEIYGDNEVCPDWEEDQKHYQEQRIKDLEADRDDWKELAEAREILMDDKNEEIAKLEAEVARLRAFEADVKALDWEGILNGISWGLDQSTSRFTSEWEKLDTDTRAFARSIGANLGMFDT